MGDRDRPKKSWRELDQTRDRGRTAERPRDGRSPQKDAQASRQHRAALDALFAKGELGKFADKLAPAARTPPRSGGSVAAGKAAEAPPPKMTPAAKDEPK